ncbi:2-succinyl-5-enolpyruvyl-6-hydroxy-3-cyclohexene-1-carboxylic-acid synthase [Brevifollis gellanilyticus]|uniref:2-succinyl-5-enolpyruvyl-6-hydroxy-3-cyclohexene-1-carboxylate synthase n=1 Tax=Brevifollis gellanilyticus TaxID=748831 RepID=A0A512M338_9BACT|nr:2-succinyl-5-enolpyruvyl-6-hydroxy-3-cyclohexene-1-carboxylic-acid synthase [Brevifollis gellanilyticus]GEP41167.1 2-succinyl-5-enolpyruvyl-6-hydroxy-3-cyclohexene- 1-carboxylate synthase [Brevifollis gellanilyticus]
MKSLLIRSTLTALARLGVAEVCVAAGARNAPLITGLMASDGIKIWSFFEERSAAFFALGRMMVDRMPVAVLTTSGTAAAELLPAVIEAHYQGLPLVLVTADRPKRFRGTGAPQAIEQKDLFGDYVSACIDVEEGTSISWPTRLTDKPLHINICLDEPLDAERSGIDFLKHHPQKPLKPAKAAPFILSGSPTVVIACGLHPHEAREAAPILKELGLPIVAEATSNLWGESPDRPSLDELLLPAAEDTFNSLEIGQVIRIGGIPSSRWWRDLESKPFVWVTNVSRLQFPGLARKQHVQTLPWHALSDFASLSLVPASIHPGKSHLEEEITKRPLCEPAWMRHIMRLVTEGDRVFIGNSLPIREMNMALDSPPPGVEFYANRGANGIDGIVSTWLGASASSRSSWLIVGDLSAMYDLSAPWIMPQLPQGNRRLVIINNQGGKIFSHVKSLQGLPEEVRHVIENNHRVSFEPWAAMWGLSYVRATLPQDLHDLPDGAVMIEVIPDARQTETFYQAMEGS